VDTIRWRLYYDDGSTYDNGCGLPEDAPKYGALVVGQVSRTDGWRTHRGGDFFVYRSDLDQWLPADIHGLVDHCLFFCRQVRAVVKGRYVTDERYNAIKRLAVIDPDLPVPSEFSR
jgi:hypothetical protein